MQVLVDWFDGRGFAKVDAHSIAKNGFAIKDLADSDRGIDVVKGNDYATKGF